MHNNWRKLIESNLVILFRKVRTIAGELLNKKPFINTIWISVQNSIIKKILFLKSIYSEYNEIYFGQVWRVNYDSVWTIRQFGKLL